MGMQIFQITETSVETIIAIPTINGEVGIGAQLHEDLGLVQILETADTPTVLAVHILYQTSMDKGEEEEEEDTEEEETEITDVNYRGIKQYNNQKIQINKITKSFQSINLSAITYRAFIIIVRSQI